MVAGPTPLFRIVERALDEPLVKWLKRKHVQEHLSWREIAEQLCRRTGESVSHETVRQWASLNKR